MAEMLRSTWHAVANPFDLHVLGVSWVEAMKADLAVLVLCDAIYMMRGWEDSEGARVERQLAFDLEKEVIYE